MITATIQQQQHDQHNAAIVPCLMPVTDMLQNSHSSHHHSWPPPKLSRESAISTNIVLSIDCSSRSC
jgi:hypothetical protein